MVSYAAIIQAMKDASKGDPRLGQSVALYIDLLELQSRVDVGPSRACLSATELTSRPQTGQPLLAPGAWTVGSTTLAPLCVQVAHTTAQRRPELAKPLAEISAWFAAHRDSLDGAVFDYLQGGCCQDALDAGLHRFVLAHGIRPFLRAEAAKLAPLMDMRIWFRGMCPICGGEPDMAALESDGGGRRLLCSRCDSEWPFYRTVCPYCGDEENVGYYAVAAGRRLYTCNSCHRYIKTIDLRDTISARSLPAERILTADMDIAARAAGWVA